MLQPEVRSQKSGAKAVRFRYEVASVWGASRATGYIEAGNRAVAEAILRCQYPTHLIVSLEVAS